MEKSIEINYLKPIYYVYYSDNNSSNVCHDTGYG